VDVYQIPGWPTVTKPLSIPCCARLRWSRKRHYSSMNRVLPTLPPKTSSSLTINSIVPVFLGGINVGSGVFPDPISRLPKSSRLFAHISNGWQETSPHGHCPQKGHTASTTVHERNGTLAYRTSRLQISFQSCHCYLSARWCM
jgi:hypothetical protein